MPTFDFTAPDGKSYSVDGPDGATPEQAFKILQDHLGGPKPEGGSSVGGVAKSLGTGLAEGLIGLAGAPGDLYHMGLRALGDNLTPESNYGSGAIKKGIEGYTGEFYKPQGTAEELASKVGQFAPAVIGGPETLAMKLATRVAAPAVASEIGGKVAGPYGEIAGALVGAGGATAAARKFQEMAAARTAAKVLPDVAELKGASRAQYQHPDVNDVQFKPEALDDLATKIEKDLKFGPNSGFREANEKPVFNAVNELRSPLERDVVPDTIGTSVNSSGLDSANASLANIFNKSMGDKAIASGPANISDVDSVRQLLRNLSTERDGAGQFTRQAVAAKRAIGHIDEFLPNLKQEDLLSGNAAKASSILGEARQNWGAAKRSEMVQNLANNAEINAASANSGANIGNATRQAFKPIAKNNFAKAVGYNDEERAALDKIIRGTWTGAATRVAGNILGGGGGLGMLAGGAAGYESGGIPGALAAGATGIALKKISNKSTLNAVANLDRMLRSRSPEAIKLAAQNPQIAQLLPPKGAQLLRAMILADPTLAQQQRQPVGQPNTY